MKVIDNFLNQVSMYRLMVYYLLFLITTAYALSFFNILPFRDILNLRGFAVLMIACYLTNQLFSKLLKIPYNIESSLITSLILCLIIGPTISLSSLPLFIISGILAISSKYLITFNKRHIFNPAAFGAVASAIILGQGASWWMGSEWTILPILLGGFLILRKIKRFRMALTFILGFLIVPMIYGVGNQNFQDLLNLLLMSPILFFAFVMLTEPQTSPYKSLHQILYGVLVAVGFYVFAALGIFYPLEAALLFGNIYAFIVNKSFRQNLILDQKVSENPNTMSFLFKPEKKFEFEPGQYLEWTLPHKNPDSRGVRRFFTIASSPTEENIMLSSKFASKSSSFKTTLKEMEIGDKIGISNLQGEFTLPPDPAKKLVFIAGGIGITPFRSMAKYLEDKGESRDIILLYSNQSQKDIVFKDIFKMKTVYVNTDIDGYIDEKLIKKEVPDFAERHFYLSGPPSMVDAFCTLLSQMGVSKGQIKTDFFPGYN